MRALRALGEMARDRLRTSSKEWTGLTVSVRDGAAICSRQNYMSRSSAADLSRSIMLPQVKPALAVIAVQTFVAAWNNFIGPLPF